MEEDEATFVSVCVKCQHQNEHAVDHNGRATPTCESCSAAYDVQTYQVRAQGGRRDRRSGITHSRIRVREPDRDESLLEFDSKEDIEIRSGDWIVGSYVGGELKYLSNSNIRQYWDVRRGMGCTVLAAFFVGIPIFVMALTLWIALVST